MMRPPSFTVMHGAIRLRVRVLPTEADVHRAYQAAPGSKALRGFAVRAFFLGTASNRNSGTIYLPARGRLAELVPHEVAHAVIHAHGGVLPADDEACCLAIGRLTADILSGITRMGVAV